MAAVLSPAVATAEKVIDKEMMQSVNASAHPDTGNSVAVIASNKQDAARITRLLGFAGISSSNVFFCDSSQSPSVQAFATVICHRLSQSDAFIALPDGANVARTIVLSDCHREETVVGFLANGARHFFNIQESDLVLQVRLEASLRQHRRVQLRSFSEGDIHFDVQKRKVTRAGLAIDLSPKEYEFACHLFSRHGKVVRNSELMTSVWSLPPDMDTRRIDTAACRVRKKLGLSRDEGWELKRIRRVGYRLSRVESVIEENTGLVPEPDLVQPMLR